MVSFSAGNNLNIQVQGNQTIIEGSQLPPNIEAQIKEFLEKNPELLKSKDKKSILKACIDKIPDITADLAPIVAKALLL